MYRKYSTRGHVERQIQHEAKPSAVFVSRHPTPECCIIRTHECERCFNWYIALCSRFRLAQCSSQSLHSGSYSDQRMDSSVDAEKQVREIVSPSLILTPPTNEPFKIFEGFDFNRSEMVYVASDFASYCRCY